MTLDQACTKTYRASPFYIITAAVILAYKTIPLWVVVLGRVLRLNFNIEYVLVLPFLWLFTIIPLIIFTFKLSVDEEGFALVFSPYRKKYQVQWSGITKVTATSGWLPTVAISHKEMKGFQPLVLGKMLSNKSLGEFLKVLVMKAPQAQLGFGTSELMNKFAKKNQVNRI